MRVDARGVVPDLTNTTTNQLASFPGPTQLSVTSTMEKWGEPGNEASDGQHLPEKASPRCDVGQPTLCLVTFVDHFAKFTLRVHAMGNLGMKLVVQWLNYSMRSQISKKGN